MHVFDNIIYEHSHGASMGAPISIVLLAELKLCPLNSEFFSIFKVVSLARLRYVGDIFII